MNTNEFKALVAENIDFLMGFTVVELREEAVRLDLGYRSTYNKAGLANEIAHKWAVRTRGY